MRAGYFGPEGTFTQEALLVASGGAPLELIPLPTIYDTVMAVHSGAVDRALVLFAVFRAGAERVVVVCGRLGEWHGRQAGPRVDVRRNATVGPVGGEHDRERDKRREQRERSEEAHGVTHAPRQAPAGRPGEGAQHRRDLAGRLPRAGGLDRQYLLEVGEHARRR